MKEKKTINKTINQNIEINLNEINTLEKYISQILMHNDFNQINTESNIDTDTDTIEIQNEFNQMIKVINQDNNIELISLNNKSVEPNSKLISEKDFFKIVGANKKGLTKRSGSYQESLYGYYLQALEENDEGFIYDVLNKAIIFQNNINYIKVLMQNKKFMKEWQRNFGKRSPIKLYQNSGNMRLIHIIRNRI